MGWHAPRLRGRQDLELGKDMTMVEELTTRL